MKIGLIFFLTLKPSEIHKLPYWLNPSLGLLQCSVLAHSKGIVEMQQIWNVILCTKTGSRILKLFMRNVCFSYS